MLETDLKKTKEISCLNQMTQLNDKKQFTGKENHFIPLDSAAELTKKFRNNNEPGITKALFYGKDAISDILEQNNCVGLRIYYALKADNMPTLVIVGVDCSGKDLVDGIIAEFGFPCPPFCPPKNILNT